MTTPDLLYLALIAAGLVLDHLVLWPGYLKRSQADPARARRWIYSGWMSMLWTLVAGGVALWVWEERGWAPLGLVVPHGWRLLVAIGLVLALAIAYARTVAKVARSTPSRRVGLRSRLGHLAVMVPHARSEVGWFVALSLSAGFCEEFIFRGYLIWVFGPACGWWGAAAISVIVFAVAHAYQGRSGMIRAGVAGVLFTLILFMFGSLLPGMVLHALMDIGSGVVGWLVVREVPGESDAATGPVGSA